MSASDWADFFPESVRRAETALVTVKQARAVADPGYAAWVVTAKRGGVSHAVRDMQTLVALCGRDIRGGVPAEPEASRCRRCLDRVGA